MFERFRNARRNREIVDALYLRIVDSARREDLYTDCGLADTVMGRFEALSIHVFLFLARCNTEVELKPLAQDIVDRFTADVEDSIREIGIGDVTVPKRMRKLVGMFYERVAAYDPALAAGDVDRLSVALKRHALLENADPEAAGRLARDMIAQKSAWDAVPAAEILRGTVAAET